ncbi:GHMP kinase [Rhizobium panacihumi]|uniref:GHMP family kinase ATP-binding protein n=1 Tax=Rhizobium panacihumi TaxID=2008450 RepID=UPI003D799BAA
MSKPWGTGTGHAHHGELLQGVFEDSDRKLRRGLLSLPCPSLTSLATFTLTEAADVTVAPLSCEKARRAGKLALAAFSERSCGGHLQIATNIPVGQGMGSSTADVVASILAVLGCLGKTAAPEAIMKIAVAAETACDSTLFAQNAVLFAQREGTVIEAFRKHLPSIDVISIDTAPETTVSTVDHRPARYSSAEIEAFRPLRSLLRTAIDRQDIGLLGRVASASARINDRFLPKPHLQALFSIASQNHAAGIQVAHSGTLVGMLFDPDSPGRDDNISHAERSISALGLPHRLLHA